MAEVFVQYLLLIDAGTTVDPRTDFKEIVRLLGHAELEMFYPELGLSDQDIEKAKINANVDDVDLKAMNVLRLWLKKKGQQATRQAVLQALERCECKNAMEQLRIKWGLTGEYSQGQ